MILIAFVLTLQVCGSAGISPLPIIGSKISANIPLQYCSVDAVFRICRAMTGSLITRNDLGPNDRLKIGPYSKKYLLRSRKSGPPANVCRSPPNTPLMNEKNEPSYFWMTALGTAAIPNAGPNPIDDRMLTAKSRATSITLTGLGPLELLTPTRCLLTKKSNVDGCRTHVPSSRIRNPAKYRRAFSISQSNPFWLSSGFSSHRSNNFASYVDVSTSWTLSFRFGMPVPDTRSRFGICAQFRELERSRRSAPSSTRCRKPSSTAAIDSSSC